MEGYLLVDKPSGWTSFDLVHFIRGKVAKASSMPSKKIKVGHSGTLDPFATGLMIILVGRKFTQKANELLKQDKSYSVTMELDSLSTTGDPEGEITRQKTELPQPTNTSIAKALESFKGDIKQTPPIYSAIKVNGVRAYKLAREDKPVELEPRMVSIRDINLLSYSYPDVKFETTVSSGTYIRSLVEDIGSYLDRTAYTKELRRTSIGLYSIDHAVVTADITEQTIGQLLRMDL